MSMLDKSTEDNQECDLCDHTLVGNLHGFDQNDGWIEGDKFIHSGHCTYCKICRVT